MKVKFWRNILIRQEVVIDVPMPDYVVNSYSAREATAAAYLSAHAGTMPWEQIGTYSSNGSGFHCHVEETNE